MKEKYYFNPFISIIENREEYIIQKGFEILLVINKDKGKEFVKKVENNEAFTITELITIFNERDTVGLFKNNVFIDEIPNMEDRESRNRGYFDIANNKKLYSLLKTKKVMLLGAGAIGTHVSWMLSTLNIGELAVLDFDVIEESNLNRQVLYEYSEIGKSKVEILKEHLKKINPSLNVKTINDRIDSNERLFDYLKEGFDIVIRAIDTPMQITLWLNECCFKLKIPYISGGFVGEKAVVGPTFIPEITSCFECYENQFSSETKRISGTAGTLAPLTELVASKMMFEIINVLIGKEIFYNGKIEIIDPLNNTSEIEEMPVKKKCELCGREYKDNRNTKDLFLLNLIYYLFVGCIPVCMSIPNWPMYGTFLLILGSQIILNLYRSEDDVFQSSFLGGALYGLSNVIITMRINSSIMFNSNEFIFSIINIAFQLVIVIAISIVIFMIVNYIIILLRKHIKIAFK